jgi:hypothetical protein
MAVGRAVTAAYCCEICSTPDPHWTIMRTGDVATSWACDGHLAVVCERFQCDDEVTELTVRDSRKTREWAAIGRALDKIAEANP